MTLGFLNINSVLIIQGLLFEKLFNNVLFFSESPNQVHLLNSKIFQSNEPELQHKLLYSEKIKALNDPIEIIDKSDIIFCYEECKISSDNRIDISPILEQIQKFYLASHSNINLYGKKFVVLSTLNFGDSKLIEEKINQFGVEFCYCPLFLTEGRLIESLENNDYLILGTTHNELSHFLNEIYSKIKKVKVQCIIVSPSVAEIIKLGSNSLIASQVVIKNTLGDILTSSGLRNEVNLVFDILNSISKKLEEPQKYNLGFSGPLIQKELSSLSELSKDNNIKFNLFDTLEKSNLEHFEYVKHYYLELNKDKSVPFIINSLSYKEGINNLENSFRLKLCLELLDEGYQVSVIETNQEIINKLSGLEEKYPDKLKFFGHGSKVEGFKISI